MNSNELEKVARRIAPGDFAGSPIYVCMSSEMPPEFRSDTFRGYHSTTLDLAYRDWLTQAGRWRGRGVCFNVNDIAIGEHADFARECLNESAEFRDHFYRVRVVNIALHELTHAITQELDIANVDASSPVVQAVKTHVLKWVQHAPALTFPWTGHDWRFIRALIHVAYRAELLGIETNNAVLLSPFTYCLSSLEKYRAALQAEIESTNPLSSFAEIRSVTPPAEFMDVWRDDVKIWLDRRSKEPEEQLRITAG